MSGSYTINSSSPTSGTNYNSFTAAIADLTTCGVSGLVTFNISAGTYNESITITGITGASSSNRIIFNGPVSPTQVVNLIYATSFSKQQVIEMNDAKFITFNRISVTASGTSFSQCFDLEGDCQYINIFNCKLSSPNHTSTSTYNKLIDIYSGSGKNANNIDITYNTFQSAFTGVSAFGNGIGINDQNNNIDISNNTFIGIKGTTINLLYLKNSTISNNSISGNYTAYSPNGIYLRGTNNKIERNQIHANNGIEVYNSYGASFAAPSLIRNNMVVVENGGTGISVRNSTYTRVLNNSVHVISSGSTKGRAFYYYGLTSLDRNFIQNNVFVNSVSGSVGYFENNVGIDELDNNIYYTLGTEPFRWYFAYPTTFSAFQLTSQKDSNSYFGYPQFVSKTDLHLEGQLANGTGANLFYVTNDFDGDSRPSSGSYDIGADEYTPPICPSPYFVRTFNRQTTSHGVHWTAGGVETSWVVEYGLKGFTQGTGSFLTSTNDSTIITGLLPKTNYDFYVRADCGSSNLSIWKGPYSFRTACANQLNGIYTINTSLPISTSNYHSIESIVDELIDCGMSGAVTINVDSASGPFMLNTSLNSITGNSAINFLKINGNGAVVNRDTNSTYFLSLENMINVEISNFNFINQLPNDDVFGIVLKDRCKNILIKNNLIDLGNNLTNVNSSCIVASGSNTEMLFGSYTTDVTIVNNKLLGGYSGINIQGKSSSEEATNYIIKNNQIEDFARVGFRSYYLDSSVISNNKFQRLNRLPIGVSSLSGIDMITSSYCKVIGNKLFNIDARTMEFVGIYIRGFTNSSTNKGKILNNVIYNNTSEGHFTGIKITSGANYTDVFHNTILINSDGVSAVSKIEGIERTSSSSRENYKNNLISIFGNGLGEKQCVSYKSISSTTVLVDNNILHMGATAGTNNIGKRNTTVYSTLANWQSGTSKDVNSLDNDPLIASGDYIPRISLVDNKGDSSVNVLYDVDSILRNSTFPDIGAAEFLGVNGDLSLDAIWIKEVGKCLGTNDTAYAKIINEFEDTIDFSTHPINVHWNITGPKASSLSASINNGKLAKGDSILVYNSNVDVSEIGIYNISGYISSNFHNGLANNDTLISFFTLEKKQPLKVSPKYDSIYTETGTVDLEIESPYLPEKRFFFTEISQTTSTSSSYSGIPVGGKPTWLSASDYVEISGAPNSDLAGCTIEVWRSGILRASYTFPSGTVLNSNGTAIVSTSGGSNNPSQFHYRMSPTYSLSTSTASGRILKDPSGKIMDAVRFGSSGSFPVSSGVDTSHWQGNLPSISLSWGYRLEGKDENSPANWVTSASSPQSPNDLNPGIVLPEPRYESGISWKELSTGTSLTDTTQKITVGPYTTNGLFQYEVTYNSPCAILKDTAFIYVLITYFDTLAPITACDSFVSPYSGKVYHTSGTYTDTVLGTNPVYDSILVTYTLSIGYPSSSSISNVSCDTYTSPSGKVWTSSGIYYDTILNSSGCDSLITVNLTINSSSSSTNTHTVCNTYTSPSGKIWTSSGTYQDTILNVIGCDSLMTFNLTVNSSSSSTNTLTVCNTYTSPSGKIWASSGIYQDTILNASGCDSLMTFNLTVNSSSSSTNTLTVCNTYTSPSGKIWTSSGIYQDTILNASGCDSLMTFNLTVNSSSSSTNTLTVCNTYTSPSGKLWTSSGTYQDTILNASGCDSLMTFNLTVNSSSSSTNTLTVCDSYTSPSGKLWTSSGTYQDTILNASGCDSLMTFNLTVNTVNAGTINVSGITLTSAATGVSYQWLDCNNGNSIIVGETGQTFKPTINGNYTCEVSSTSGCKDTSVCVLVNSVGVSERETLPTDLVVFPNPVSDILSVNLNNSKLNKKYVVELYNIKGKLLKTEIIKSGKSNFSFNIDVSEFVNGIYLIKISDEDAIVSKKVIISH